MSQHSIFEILQQVAQNIPGCLMTSVVDADSGMSLASVSQDTLSAATADAYHADLYRSIERSMNMLENPKPVEGVVLVGESAVFISAPFLESTYFWHVVTDLDTTVGFTQALMRKYRPQVEESLRQVLA